MGLAPFFRDDFSKRLRPLYLLYLNQIDNFSFEIFSSIQVVHSSDLSKSSCPQSGQNGPVSSFRYERQFISGSCSISAAHSHLHSWHTFFISLTKPLTLIQPQRFQRPVRVEYQRQLIGLFHLIQIARKILHRF